MVLDLSFSEVLLLNVVKKLFKLMCSNLIFRTNRSKQIYYGIFVLLKFVSQLWWLNNFQTCSNKCFQVLWDRFRQIWAFSHNVKTWSWQGTLLTSANNVLQMLTTFKHCLISTPEYFEIGFGIFELCCCTAVKLAENLVTR